MCVCFHVSRRNSGLVQLLRRLTRALRPLSKAANSGRDQVYPNGLADSLADRTELTRSRLAHSHSATYVVSSPSDGPLPESVGCCSYISPWEQLLLRHRTSRSARTSSFVDGPSLVGGRGIFLECSTAIRGKALPLSQWNRNVPNRDSVPVSPGLEHSVNREQEA